MTMTRDAQDYDHARQMTARSLHKIVETTEQLTHLSLPDRSFLIDEIARVVPAGNMPSLIAAGLAKIPGRSVPVADSRRNLSLLMKGMQTFMDKAVYQTFFVGPATVLSAYQMLLTLTGKNLNESFPEGTWQFYVEFGIREDSGRHTFETVGFQKALAEERLHLNQGDELACWMAASAWLLDRYHILLANEWNEHARLRHFEQTTGDRSIKSRWLKSRPYTVPGGTDADFPEYRQVSFDAFCNGVLADLNPRLRNKIEDDWNTPTAISQRDNDRSAYQRQMSILAMLQPHEYSDSRVPIGRNRLCLAAVSGGRYYVIDINGPVSVERARPISAAIIKDKADFPTASVDKLLSVAKRHNQPALRRLLSEYNRTELERLRLAPIILNWDSAPGEAMLRDIRNGRRGIGDQPFTIFRTSLSTVFDLSHIFFDGPWGMAVAEILTGKAIVFARQLARAPKVVESPQVRCLDLEAPSEMVAPAQKAQILQEVSGETTLVNFSLLEQVKINLLKRNTKLQLTINDILILYRALFNQLYQPSSELLRALPKLTQSTNVKIAQAGQLALATLEELGHINPVLLIPIDATGVNPRERIYATTFQNPFTELIEQHRKVLRLHEALDRASLFARPLANRAFEDARREYLGTIYAFGQVVAKYKELSLAGKSVSTATIKLLAGLPAPVQRMLDSVPDTFDLINDVVKGQEVFSNVGRVSPASSLTRFNTAKDDNEKKVLAWGIMTDSSGTMHISLRDSRPHVAALIAVKQGELAQQMTQEFVDAYALTMNNYLKELILITRARANKGS